jgi:uncharacterized protein (DUF1778 family)
MTDTEKINARIPRSLKKAFEQRAEVENRTLTEILIRAMEQAAKRWGGYERA